MPVSDVRWFLAHYLSGAQSSNDPDFAPLYAADLSVLPPTLTQTAEHDILTGQAEQYGEALRASGVPVSVTRYDGMIHGFVTLDAFLPGAAGDAIGEMGRFVDGLAG